MESQEFGGRLLQRSKKKDPQKHAAMLHAARQNIIAVQGAWAIDLHHGHVTKVFELNWSIQTLNSNQPTDSAAVSNKLGELENISETLEEVKGAVQNDEVLAIAHKLNRSFQTLRSSAAKHTTKFSRKLEHFPKTLEKLERCCTKKLNNQHSWH